MAKLTEKEIAAFVKQWATYQTDYLIGKHAPYYIPKPWRIQRDLREGKRGIIDGIKWAQDGRAMADVEIVLKASPSCLLDQSTDDERLRFDEGFPCFVRVPCMHAAATTPAQRLGVLLRSLHPAVSAFPDMAVRSACTLSFSRFARRSLALRPAHSRCHRIS